MRNHPEISHHDARVVIDTIGARLDADGLGAAVAVVDSHGELVALLRTDGCPLPSITIAVNKAYTAARQRMPSAGVGAESRDAGFPMTNFGELRYVTWGGGVPVVVGGAVVGAVGVSGLPEAVDVELAELGTAAIAD
jgi:glc operon protein GlcG